MAASMPPPSTPSPVKGRLKRPTSLTFVRPSPRSVSRLSMASKAESSGAGSRSSDDESQTAVKVAIRVRPPLTASDPGHDLIPQRFRHSVCDTQSPTNISIQSPQGKKLFVYDRVFGPSVTQEGVWDYISGSVESFILGYNVTILAYGQSGAGKSYTMGTSGPEEQNDDEACGIVPRAAAAIFRDLEATSSTTKLGAQLAKEMRPSGIHRQSSMPRLRETSGKDWELKASYLEIYNEQLRDLLLSESVRPSERAQIQTREDSSGRIHVTGLQEIAISSAEELLEVLNFGSSVRQTDATTINAKSSRSHAVFSLTLTRKKSAHAGTPTTDKRLSLPPDSPTKGSATTTTVSKLHFVDLAGSERLKNTGAQGERAKEGISINAGLAALGKVIAQLSTKQTGRHIAYRDSKLTRLLQDSLGGNAITYMVACVNPAEFHLSETMNTLSYAQRARAIQSRPEIQEVVNDEEKNAQIARLKEEVRYLRAQINAQGTGRRITSRSEGPNSKVYELESQILDMQETHQALEQRHARLIAEIGKQPNGHVVEPSDGIAAHESVQRLERSSSFAEAAENMVAEYETTIKSLEASLSSARANLSSTESTLLERESKIAYLEAATQQSDQRIRKMLDHQGQTGNYLRQLEDQLEGVTTDGEATSTLIQGLKTELVRAKEGQDGANEYITTLETRLAEAEQDHLALKNELGRLEQVVDRQRLINQKSATTTPGIVPTSFQFDSLQTPNGPHAPDDTTSSKQLASPPSPLRDDEILHLPRDERPVSPLQGADHDVVVKQHASTALLSPLTDEAPLSAQSQFMADKVETLTQELFDLRGEHETTIGAYDELQRKYAIALQALARSQDVDNKADTPVGPITPPQRSDSFLGRPLPGGPAHGLNGDPLQFSPSGYSSVSDSKSPFGNTTTTLDPSSIPLPQGGETTPLSEAATPTSPELEQLRESHERLLEAHREVLDEVGLLKSELQKSQILRTPSPVTTKSPLSRRKTSTQDLANTLRNFDVANRAFASLRNIALDSFEHDHDIRQNFETQLNYLMSEIHMRSEKAQGLEAEARTLRQQLDGKTILIAGLTRERSSLRSRSSLDFSAVSTMREQVLRSEEQIKSLLKVHEEQKIQSESEIAALREQLGTSSHEFHKVDSATAEGEIKSLQSQLSVLEDKHNNALTASQNSEKRLLATISDLEAALKAFDTSDHHAQVPDLVHQTAVNTLQRQLEDHIAAADIQAQKMAQLETVHSEAIKSLEQSTADKQMSEADIAQHRDMISDLQEQVQQQHRLAQEHETSLAQLKESYAGELEEIRSAHQQSQERATVLQEEHEDALDAMEKEIREHQATSLGLLAGLATVLGRPVDYGNFETQVKDLVVAKRTLETQQAQSSAAQKDLEAQLQAMKTMIEDLEKQLANAESALEKAQEEVEELNQKDLKSSHLIAELEDQLTSNYDHNRNTTKRLSQLQTEKHLQLREALHSKSELEKDLEDSRVRITHLESQLADNNRRSSSTVRGSGAFGHDQLSPEAAAFAFARSTSPISSNGAPKRRASPPIETSALPSPPPTTPLPPLPSSPSAHSPAMFERGIVANRPMSPTPPGTTDPAMLKRLEDTEARIRTVEKHLYAEKQLTATLEEALVDLETAQTKTRQDLEAWRTRATGLEDEIIGLRKEREMGSRATDRTVEAERELRVRAEQAKRMAEERMKGLEMERRRKKKSALTCF